MNNRADPAGLHNPVAYHCSCPRTRRGHPQRRYRVITSDRTSCGNRHSERYGRLRPCDRRRAVPYSAFGTGNRLELHIFSLRRVSFIVFCFQITVLRLLHAFSVSPALFLHYYRYTGCNVASRGTEPWLVRHDHADRDDGD